MLCKDPQKTWLCSCHFRLRLIWGNENPNTGNLFVLLMGSAERQSRILWNPHHISVTNLSEIQWKALSLSASRRNYYLFAVLFTFRAGNGNCSMMASKGKSFTNKSVLVIKQYFYVLFLQNSINLSFSWQGRVFPYPLTYWRIDQLCSILLWTGKGWGEAEVVFFILSREMLVGKGPSCYF